MAHKKGVGSSKNGRESESKRLGVNSQRQVTLSYVNVAPFTTRVRTWEWAATTLCSLFATVS